MTQILKSYDTVISKNVLEGKQSLISTGAFTLNCEYRPITNNSGYLYSLTEIFV